MCSLIPSVIVTVFVLFIIKLISNSSIQSMRWYGTLKKSVLTPPDWVFGLVWTILYMLIALSFILFWSTGCTHQWFYALVTLYGINIATNMVWPILFFKLHRIKLAFINCAITTVTAYLLIGFLFTDFTKSALLLIPYALWLTFATYLNAQVRTK